MRSTSLLLLLGFSATAGASPLDRAATRLVDELALPSVERFSLEEDLAVVVQLDPPAARILSGLLIARLGALGAGHVRVVTPGPNADARARDAGAEWLLAVHGGPTSKRLTLWAELRRVDPGLWSKPPAQDAVPIFATARHVAEVELAALPPDVPPPPPTRAGGTVQLRGPALRVRSVSEPVLALAACPVLDPAVDDLVLLTEDRVEVLSFAAGRVRSIGRLALTDLPRHPAPTREVVGRVVCVLGATDRVSLAVGHSGLATGLTVRVKRKAKTVLLEPAETIPAIPVAALGGARFLLAKTDAGTPRLQLERGEQKAAELMFDVGRFGKRTLAVLTDYRLVELGDRLEIKSVLGTSGVGFSAVDAEGGPYVVTTNNRPGGNDQLTLLTSVADRRRETNPIPIEGAVFATVIGRFRSEATEVIAAARTPTATHLLLIPLEGLP